MSTAEPASNIWEIQRQLVEVYHFPPMPVPPLRPGVHVPDGEYPMVINGRTDRVRIVNGKIQCCNWEPAGEAG